MKTIFANIINIQPGVCLGISMLLLCRKFLKKNYRAKLNYMLWGVILLRLCLPFDISLPDKTPQVIIPVENYYITQSSAATENIFANFEFVPRTEYENTPQEPVFDSIPTENVIIKSTPPAVSVFDLIVKIWICIAAILTVTAFAPYFLLKKKILDTAVYSKERSELLTFIKTKLNIRQKVDICVCDYYGSPMLMGVTKPVIVLPRQEYNRQQLAMIISHELTHLKRFDVVYKMVLQIVKYVYWFNPLIWLMARYAEEDIELSCDEEITKSRNKDFKLRYADAILKVAAGTADAPVLSTAFSTDAENIKERFANIFFGKVKKNGKNILTGFMAVIIAATTFVGCGSENKIIETPVTAQFLKFNDIKFSEDGKAFIVSNPEHNYTRRITVTDLNTNQTKYLCHNENCTHSDDSCVSFTGGSAFISIADNGEKIFLLDSPVSEKTTQYILYSINSDGTGKEMIYKSDYSQHTIANVAVINGQTLYIQTSKGGTSGILKIDTVTKETEHFYTEGRVFSFIDCDNENIYIHDFSYPDGTINPYYIKAFNMETEEFTTLFTSPDYMLDTLYKDRPVYYFNKKVYMSNFKNDLVGLYEYDLTTGEFKTLSENLFDVKANNINMSYGNNGILFFTVLNSEQDDIITLYYDAYTGKTGEITLNNNQFPILPYSDKYGDYLAVSYNPQTYLRTIIHSDGSTGTRETTYQHWSLISREDYLSNNPNFIFLNPVE